MKDKGLNRGLVQDFNTSDKRAKHAFYGFRKMFWDYLTKLNVPFYDPCCEDAGGGSVYTQVRFNTLTGQQEYYDIGSQSWIQTDSWVATTTTTTAAPTTTTTTTAAPTTTTTTTAAPSTTTTTTT